MRDVSVDTGPPPRSAGFQRCIPFWVARVPMYIGICPCSYLSTGKLALLHATLGIFRHLFGDASGYHSARSTVRGCRQDACGTYRGGMFCPAPLRRNKPVPYDPPMAERKQRDNSGCPPAVLQFVYQLCGLTADEIRIVEDATR